ncbi:MAG: hypothetical protein M1820_002480 [Bogoriella megaspora]|nr:MAG: hypothetical protein M1820_002480 [Bogoriella megaspora]
MPGAINEADEKQVKTLEQRYITLLEQKIAQLESSLAAKDKSTGDSNGSSTNGDTSEKKRKESISSVGAVSGGEKETSENDKKQKSNGEANGDASDKKDTDTDDTEENGRIRALDNRYNEKTGVWENVPSKLPIKSKGSEPSPAYAFTWLRSFDLNQKYESAQAKINSPELEELIKNTCRASSSTNFSTFTGNFDPLVWDWNKLEDAIKEREVDNDATKVARSDLSLLLDQVKSTQELQRYFERRDEWAKNGEIEFDFLWTLFPPGELLYSQVVFDYPQAFIAREYSQITETPRSGSEKSYFEVSCWSYDWDGETFSRVAGKLKIEQFAGAKPINTLRFFPLKYHVDGNGNSDVDDIRSTLKERGKKFRQFCTAPKGSQLFYVDGPVLASKKGGFTDLAASNNNQFDGASSVSSDTIDTSGGLWSPSRTRGPAIVDHKSYIQCSEDRCARMGAFALSDDVDECTCSICMKSRALKNMMKFGYDNVKGNKEFEDDQYIICPARFLGYIMGSKAWAQMPVDCVTQIKQKVKLDAFENLIMDKNAKILIKGLVGNHEKKKLASGDGKTKGREDWIEGKGKGLVILLHGPPGVGKSSTAESVAQATGKPLFTVSVNDIGLQPDKVEGKLDEIFNLAAKWEAVLLFDEADVFLESRGQDKGDLNRNSLVTVFLRILEYYDGILILTTNRIKSFDVAVQSRVHLAVRYQKLNVTQRKELCSKFIKQHPDEFEDMDAVLEWVENDFEDEIDGRQIRNIISSARAMAKSDDNPSGKVNKKHIKDVMKMTVQFQLHLRDQRVTAAREQVNDG